MLFQVGEEELDINFYLEVIIQTPLRLIYHAERKGVPVTHKIE